MSLLESFRKAQARNSGNEESPISEKSTGLMTTQIKITTDDFESILSKCIVAGLGKFGKSVPQAVVYHSKWISGLDEDEIPKEPEKLERTLDRIFRAGSIPIKIAVINEVRAFFGLKQNHRTFRSCFEAARRAYRSSSRHA